MILIRFLIIYLCILYIIRSLARIFLPMLFQSLVNKATQQQQGRPQNYQQQQQRRQEKQRQHEGTVKIDHIPAGKKGKLPDTEGDFVDYEEIK